MKITRMRIRIETAKTAFMALCTATVVVLGGVFHVEGVLGLGAVLLLATVWFAWKLHYLRQHAGGRRRGLVPDARSASRRLKACEYVTMFGW